MACGKQLKEILKRKNMTTKELAEKSGVSVNTLYGIIQRDNLTIKPDINIKILKVLGTNLNPTDEISEALEKQIPKTPYYSGDGYYNGELVYDIWQCPNCNKEYELEYDEYNYCPACGQKIDWSIHINHIEDDSIEIDGIEQNAKDFRGGSQKVDAVEAVE